MSGETVKVIVRCRPINGRERDLNSETVVDMVQGVTCLIRNPAEPDGSPKSFTFDGAYFVDSTTEQIYNDVGFSLVESVLEGYNGTVFAYGQTGCGKSFSMQGITDPATQRGIIPRAFEHIFEVIQTSEDMKYLVHASYLEIYNEEIRDLLGENVKKKLDLKEHPERGVYVSGLSQHAVHNTNECESLMEKGWEKRSTGATLMNAESSRSHSIFTIAIEMMSTAGDSDAIRSGKLNLVDLAGSERLAKTGATGDRQKEAAKINLSLSALGNVISALVDGGNKQKHIPYRDSKLTRLLQDSLGGNTKTLMVACLSPADNNYDETLSTLRYANRAKNIKNKPKINEDPKDAMLREYQEEIRKLKDMLDKQGPVETGMKPFAGYQKVVSVAPDEKALEQEREKVRLEFDEQMRKMKQDMEAERKSNVLLQADMDVLKRKYEEELAVVNQKIQEKTDLRRQQSQNLLLQQESQNKLLVPKKSTGARTGIGTTTTDDGLVFEDVDNYYDSSNSPATGIKTQNAEMMTSMQEEALKRLKELQLQMVGGEKSQDKELKAKRMKRKKYLEKRKKILSEALKNVDDEEGIMIKVYDDIHEELKAKTELAKKQKQKLKSMEQEVADLSEEFQNERSDYLETIRKQDQQIKLLQAIVEKVQPTIRKDCNYSDLDGIKKDAYWDDEYLRWKIPDLTVVKTKLPPAGPISSTQAKSDLLTKFNECNNSINNNNSDYQYASDRLQVAMRNPSQTAPARLDMWEDEQNEDKMLKSFAKDKNTAGKTNNEGGVQLGSRNGKGLPHQSSIPSSSSTWSGINLMVCQTESFDDPDSPEDGDPYLQQKLQRGEQEDIAGSYFKPKRAKELLGKFKGDASSLPEKGKKFSNSNNLNMSMSQSTLAPGLNLNSSFNNSPFNNLQGSSYNTWGPSSTVGGMGNLGQNNIMSTYGGSGGALNNMSSSNNVTSNGWLGEIGGVSSEGSLRRPTRLEALPSVNQKNNKKKSRDVLHTLDLI